MGKKDRKELWTSSKGACRHVLRKRRSGSRPISLSCYSCWENVYNNSLIGAFELLSKQLNHPKVKKKKDITYEELSYFLYQQSTGFLTQFHDV